MGKLHLLMEIMWLKSKARDQPCAEVVSSSAVVQDDPWSHNVVVCIVTMDLFRVQLGFAWVVWTFIVDVHTSSLVSFRDPCLLWFYTHVTATSALECWTRIKTLAYITSEVVDKEERKLCIFPIWLFTKFRFMLAVHDRPSRILLNAYQTNKPPDSTVSGALLKRLWCCWGQEARGQSPNTKQNACWGPTAKIVFVPKEKRKLLLYHRFQFVTSNSTKHLQGEEANVHLFYSSYSPL